MSGLKRKTQDTDDWGLVYSSSSGTDTDSSDDEVCTSGSKRSKSNKKQHVPKPPFLIQLPHELLCEIFILSSNAALPLVCRTLAYQLYDCPESVKLRWLLYRHGNDIQAAFYAGVLFPFFTTGLLRRMDTIYCNEQQRHHQQDTSTNPPATMIPYTQKKMPPHLFSNTTLDDELITILLDRGGSPDKPKGYPLVKSAQLGRMDRVQQLVKYGANPTLRNNMALRVCAARNNMEMVLYFLDQLNVTPDSETLRACAQKKLWDMVQVLVDHGAVPDMDTLNVNFA